MPIEFTKSATATYGTSQKLEPGQALRIWWHEMRDRALDHDMGQFIPIHVLKASNFTFCVRGLEKRVN